MARKSRKNITADNAVQTVVNYKAAAYIRLSAENELTLNAGSINNQEEFVRKYISEKEEIELYDVYIDDDITGTNYNRPEFQRLMADIIRKRVNTVIVKDLSRLGRNLTETGELIEMTFPRMNVRVIAITDKYDSNNGTGGLSVAVTNLMNEYYARDISKKICSAMQTMQQNGIPTGKAPYGYKLVKDENNNNKMVIDDAPAAVVKEIFDLFISGKTRREIADILNEKGVLTPYCYRLRNKPESLIDRKYLCWTSSNINNILSNDTYTGRYTTGKRVQAFYKNEGRHFVPQSEWTVFEDHHEPIISKEDFAKACKIAETYTIKHKPYEKRTENLFRGKLFCGCGSALVYAKGAKNSYYHCYKKYTYGKELCGAANITYDYIANIVLNAIKEQMDFLLEEDKVIKELSKNSETAVKKNMLLSRQSERQHKMQQACKLKSELYSDYTDGLLTEKEYIALNLEYSRRIESIEKDIENITQTIQTLEKSPMDMPKAKELIDKYRNKRKLTQDMVDALISKVIVHDRQNIEIYFSFDDVLEETLLRQTERQAVLND